MKNAVSYMWDVTVPISQKRYMHKAAAIKISLPGSKGLHVQCDET